MASEKIYKVFVSSTYEDLREERAAVQKGLLQLGCLPVGMELFPAADEETWSFIKSQIDDSDYYVVVIAGRYGSQAADGVSFTEKEYDYAIGQKRPAIGFVHADPGSITFDRTERAEDAREKLRKFVAKVRTRPVRPFRTPHELALEVTTSFVQLIRDRPAVGYVRSDEAVDFKRYSELLEENSKLKEALRAQELIATEPFAAHLKRIQLTRSSFKGDSETIECSLGEAFRAVGEGTLIYDEQGETLKYAACVLFKDDNDLYFDETSVRLLRRNLTLYGLIEVSREERTLQNKTTFQFGKIDAETRSTSVWRLTDFGRRQLAAMVP